MREGWEVKAFEDCVDRVRYPKKILKKSFLSEGEFPIISQEQEFINGYWDGGEEVFKTDTPVVIFGDHTKVLKYVDFDFVLGADGVKILQPKEFLFPKYFYYFLMAFPVSALGYARHYRILKELSVRFPSSLAEQKRIVGVLDQAFAGIEQALAAARKNRANARELFETTLNTTFTQKGEGWVETTLGEIGRTQTGSTPKTSEKDNFGSFIPFIKPADFYADGGLNYDNAGLSQKGLSGSRLIRAGSALMVCIGATIGKSGFSECDVSANQQINAVTPTAEYSAKFVYYQMITTSFQKSVLDASGQATLPIINKSKWSALNIHFPSSLETQIEIVHKLDTLSTQTQALEALYQQKIDALNELKQSLLQQAFAGELTTTQEDAA